jgi:hypothetical protein
MLKWSSLVENSIFSPVFEWLKEDGDHWITGLKNRLENDHVKTRRSGIRLFTVYSKPNKFVWFSHGWAKLDCFIQKKNIFITFYV